MGEYFKVHGVEGYSNGKYVRGPDYFEIEDGILVFYEEKGPHDADSVSLGDVADANRRAVCAFNEWDYVELNT